MIEVLWGSYVSHMKICTTSGRCFDPFGHSFGVPANISFQAPPGGVIKALYKRSGSWLNAIGVYYEQYFSTPSSFPSAGSSTYTFEPNPTLSFSPSVYPSTMPSISTSPSLSLQPTKSSSTIPSSSNIPTIYQIPNEFTWFPSEFLSDQPSNAPTQSNGGDDPPGDDPSSNDISGNDPSGADPSGNDQSGDNPSGDDSSGNDPSGNNLSGNNPSVDNPSGDNPSGDKPSGDSLSDNGPLGDNPSGDDSSGNNPSCDDPPGNNPSRDDPKGDGPSGDNPSGEDPSGDDPSGDNPPFAPSSPNNTNPPTDPTIPPTDLPTNPPTDLPTNPPTSPPSNTPTFSPSKYPSTWPSLFPTGDPTSVPSIVPSIEPSSGCSDDNDWVSSENVGCGIVNSIMESQENTGFNFCDFIGDIVNNRENSTQACCICRPCNNDEQGERLLALGFSCLHPKPEEKCTNLYKVLAKKKLKDLVGFPPWEAKGGISKTYHFEQNPNIPLILEDVQEQWVTTPNKKDKKIDFCQSGQPDCPQDCPTFKFLRYAGGYVTYTEVQRDVPVMSGQFSGCKFIKFLMNNKSYVAHIGTCGRETEATVNVRRAWNNFVEQEGVSVTGIFNPFGEPNPVGDGYIYAITDDKLCETISLLGTNYKNTVEEYKIAFLENYPPIPDRNDDFNPNGTFDL